MSIIKVYNLNLKELGHFENCFIIIFIIEFKKSVNHLDSNRETRMEKVTFNSQIKVKK